jgi:hypothetical protein
MGKNSHVWLAEVQNRRLAASTLRRLGVAVDEIACRLSAGVRSVRRWLAELDPLVRSRPGPSALSDFARPPRPGSSQASSVDLPVPENDVVGPKSETSHGTSARSEASTEVSSTSPFGTNGTGEHHANEPETSLAYIRRRIGEIVNRISGDARPP